MSISKLIPGETDVEELPNSALQHLDTPDTSADFNSSPFNALELISECKPALHDTSRTAAVVNKKPSPSLQNVSSNTSLEPEREALFHSAIVPKMWLSDLKKISGYVEGKRREGGVMIPVRVAILDTGLDKDLPVFKENSGLLKNVTEVKDFVEPSTPTMTDTFGHDTFGHGTFMARLIMECAPGVEILVARVARNTNELKNSQVNIKEAILWAWQTGKADIISMSFGFPSDDQGICDAIETAQKKRKGKIIFLASAGNSPTDDESFPARHSSVISVYATNCYGTFLESNSASTSNGAAVLGTYGDDIPDSIREEFTKYPTVSKPGSSVATAIMAGISATMLAYASVLSSLVPLQVGAASTVNNLLRHLWTAKGMEAVLYRLVQEDCDRPRLKAVNPMWFWKNKQDDTIRCFSICDALSDVDR
ncbi:peptidase S8/S53 domain-containing protein, partial [Chaetomium sp. MPI-SDFR-AT-0129]